MGSYQVIALAMTQQVYTENAFRRGGLGWRPQRLKAGANCADIGIAKAMP